MIKLYLQTVIFIILFSGCGQNSKKSTSEKPEIESKPSNVCNVDSITIFLFDKQTPKQLSEENLSGLGHIKTFKDPLLQKFRPYLKDSLIHKYSLFRNEVFAKLSTFHEGELCQKYYVVYNGNGKVAQEKDTSVAFLIPNGYQYRIKIPNRVWRQLLKEL